MKNVSRKLYAIYFIAIYLLAIVVDILTFISNIHIMKMKSGNKMKRKCNCLADDLWENGETVLRELLYAGYI